MKVYHIKTVERDLHDPMGFDTFDLDSLYLFDKGFLIGFVKSGSKSKKRGILSYPPYPSIYAERIEALLHGKNELRGTPVKGNIIKEIDLDNKALNRIKANYMGNWVEQGHVYHYRDVKLKREFDGSTEMLVEILSSNLSLMSKLEGLAEKLLFLKF